MALTDVMDRLRCRQCQGTAFSERSPLVYECDSCGTPWFHVSPQVVRMIDDDEQTEEEQREANFHDSENDSEERRGLELTRPYGFFRSYEFVQLFNLNTARHLLAQCGLSLLDNTMLSLCCGRGMDLDFFARIGACVSGIDISLSSLLVAEERMTETYPHLASRLEVLVHGSVSELPFNDGSWDIAYVHDGLHHVEDPLVAMREMCRVARKGVLVVEPNDSRLMRTLTLLGIAPQQEPAGNYVHRFTRSELAAIARQFGFGHVSADYAFLTCPHTPQRIFKILDWPPALWLLKSAVGLSRNLFRGQCNHLVFLAYRG